MVLKLCESQDRYEITVHTKFQLPKCRWSRVITCQSRGICMGIGLKPVLFTQNRGICWPRTETKIARRWWDASWLSIAHLTSLQGIDGEEVRRLQCQATAVLSHFWYTLLCLPWRKPTQPQFCTSNFWWSVAMDKRIGLCNTHRLWLHVLHRRGLND